VLSGRGLCDELITRPEESYWLLRRCVWSRNIKNRCSIYIYDISSLRVKLWDYFSTHRCRSSPAARLVAQCFSPTFETAVTVVF
jgi:hypothetical protein